MAITVPSIGGQSVGNAALSAPQIRSVAPDTSGAELQMQAANIVGGLANQRVVRERESADTAALAQAASS